MCIYRREVWSRGGPPPLPPLPTGSLPVLMCWCSAQDQYLSISLTSPIKKHSANEPSLSPRVIKAYFLICTRALADKAFCFSFGSAATPLLHRGTQRHMTCRGQRGDVTLRGSFYGARDKLTVCYTLHIFGRTWVLIGKLWKTLKEMWVPCQNSNKTKAFLISQ